MRPKKKYLLNDKEHALGTHDRWVKGQVPLNRDIDSDEYKESWTHEPCFLCIYYVSLQGKLGFDWGVCTNPKSQFDGRVMFEHDGCDYFEIVDDDEYGKDVEE